MKTRAEANKIYTDTIPATVERELQRIESSIETISLSGKSSMDYDYKDRNVITEIIKRLKKLGYRVDYITDGLFFTKISYNDFTGSYHIKIHWD
jgi:hypothetical protein